MNKVHLLLVVLALVLLTTAACNSPQPLPIAPTQIPVLIPATMPAPEATAELPEAMAITFPTEPPSAAAGEAVFQAHCASCHGADGSGVVEGARDFSDADYLRGAAPVHFYQVISGGKGSMPALGDQLSEEEHWNVTFYLWSFSVTSDELALGQTVYATNCVACHAADGSGAIPQAPKLTDVEFIASYPASEFFQAVTGGKGIMPAWQDRLSTDERWAAVEYARAFAYQPLGQ